MTISFFDEFNRMVNTVLTLDWTQLWTVSGTAYVLVAAAELGDKSQLVCMTLASRHKHWPVFWGAVIAFALLDLIAVAFGAVAGDWIPKWLLIYGVAILFLGFGVQQLLSAGDSDEKGTIQEKKGHSIFVTTFLMLFVAEFGDKTQLAVAGLGASEPAVSVWIGSTAALITTSALGVWVGKKLMKRVSTQTVHWVSGLLFIAFGLFAGFEALPDDLWLSIHNAF